MDCSACKQNTQCVAPKSCQAQPTLTPAYIYVTIACAYQGPHFGTSQTAKAAATSKHEVVWNFPIDIAFKSTNAFGWPRLVLSVRVELVWLTWHTRANDKSDEVLMVYFPGALH